MSVHELDKLLKPYAEMSYNKNIELYKGAGSPADEIERLAKEKTMNDIHDAMQSLEYDINTMITSSAQTPFTTVSYGLGESWLEKEIQKQHLKVRGEGLGKDKVTAIFPKILYFVQDGVNLRKEDPNYDIKQLAIKTSAERIYPDMINVDDLMELKGGKKPITAMGCVRAGEQITWRERGKKTVVTPISELFEKYADDVKIQPNGKDEYIDLKDIEIKDSHTGEAEFVSCSRVIKNNGNKWLRIKITNGRLIECTDDHPFHTINRGRVLAKDLKEGDEIRLAEDELQDEELTPPEQIELDRNWLLGNIICDGTLHANSYVLITYAMYGEDEIRERIGRVYDQDKLYDKEQHRGDRGFYKEVSIRDPELRKECVESFRGVLKEDRKIPEEIFTQNRKMRLAFLGGMIDADGYINKNSSKIQIGSVNKELALGQFMLMASLGMNPKVYTNKYNSKSNKIRYRVEANATREVIDEVVCVKKKENYTEKRRRKANPKAMVREITPLDIDEPSYDVTTESDFFDVSGIVSHNCRSFLHYWEDNHGEEIYTGRNNLGVVSLNLPHLAIQSKGNIDAFFENLDDALELVRKALHVREDSAINADIEFLPILYTQGGLGDPTGKKTARDFYDGDRKKQASISIGFVGLHNAMVALTGNEDWHYVRELNDLSVQIIKHLHDYAGKIDEEFLAAPSVYSTPSESLADRFAKIDRERFGVIEGVNGGEYYENSFHFPSNKDIDPVSKMRFESQYYQYTPGGFMFYVEQNNLSENLKGMESIWNGFNHFGNIYAGVNSPNDHCLECGWEGESSFVKDQGYTCPSCGNFDPDRMSVVRRLCGYLGHPNKRPVVSGKQDEISARVKHN